MIIDYFDYFDKSVKEYLSDISVHSHFSNVNNQSIYCIELLLNY